MPDPTIYGLHLESPEELTPEQRERLREIFGRAADEIAQLELSPGVKIAFPVKPGPP